MKLSRHRVLLWMLGCGCALLLLLPSFALLPSPPSSLFLPRPGSCASFFSPIASGGFNHQRAATPHIQYLVTVHDSAIKRTLNITSPTIPLTALSWCYQVVSGTNYAVSVQVGTERVVTVQIFLAFFWYFSGEEGERLRESNRVRSRLSQVDGRTLEGTMEDFIEHEMPWH